MIKLGELFCGPGGFAEGAKKAKGFEHVWANDIDPNACDTFQKHHPDCDVVRGDVYEEFINKRMKNLKKIDGLIFGFPCNDFSMAGKKQALKGKYGPLYFAACKVMKFFKPKFFVAENVSAIMSPLIRNKEKEAVKLADKYKNTETFLNFKKIITDLASCSPYGYRVYADKFRFEEYGIPQTRHRQILVGYRGDFFDKNNIQYEKPLTCSRLITCKEALEIGVPETKQNSRSLKKAKNQEHTKHSSKVLKRLANTKEGQNVWQISDEFGLPNVKSARMSNIYKKLDSTRPSYTVTGSGGGGTHVYHYKENRALTNRERARLQTFDDSYDFIGSKESVRKQIGMAVPVLVAKKILVQVKKSLNKRKMKKNIHHDIMVESKGKELNISGKISSTNQLELKL